MIANMSAHRSIPETEQSRVNIPELEGTPNRRKPFLQKLEVFRFDAKEASRIGTSMAQYSAGPSESSCCMLAVRILDLLDSE